MAIMPVIFTFFLLSFPRHLRREMAILELQNPVLGKKKKRTTES